MALLYLKNLIFPSRDYRRLTGPSSYDVDSTLPIASTTHAGGSGSSTGSRSSVDERDEKDYTHSRDGSSKGLDPRFISYFTLGFSDGLTVPFALTAGLSALGTSSVVIYGGLSELIAGTISMGMGGFLGARGEHAAYIATLAETQALVRMHPEDAGHLIKQTFATCDLPPALLGPMVSYLQQAPQQCVDFLMHFHHHMPHSSFSPKRAYINGMVTAGGYVVGGIVPLLPYLFVHNVHVAFHVSIVTTAMVLFLFGWMKTRVVGEKSKLKCAQSAVEMLLLGGFAAGAAVGCVRLLKSEL